MHDIANVPRAAGKCLQKYIYTILYETKLNSGEALTGTGKLECSGEDGARGSAAPGLFCLLVGLFCLLVGLFCLLVGLFLSVLVKMARG